MRFLKIQRPHRNSAPEVLSGENLRREIGRTDPRVQNLGDELVEEGRLRELLACDAVPQLLLASDPRCCNNCLAMLQICSAHSCQSHACSVTQGGPGDFGGAKLQPWSSSPRLGVSSGEPARGATRVCMGAGGHLSHHAPHR